MSAEVRAVAANQTSQTLRLYWQAEDSSVPRDSGEYRGQRQPSRWPASRKINGRFHLMKLHIERWRTERRGFSGLGKAASGGFGQVEKQTSLRVFDSEVQKE